MESCANCHFAHSYPHPGERPVEPLKTRLAAFFSSGPSLQQETDEWLWEIDLKRHEENIRCYRFPEAIKKLKTAVCGEHQSHNPER